MFESNITFNFGQVLVNLNTTAIRRRTLHFLICFLLVYTHRCPHRQQTITTIRLPITVWIDIFVERKTTLVIYLTNLGMVYGAAFATYASQLPASATSSLNSSTLSSTPTIASSTSGPLSTNFTNYPSMMPMAMLSNGFQSNIGMPPRKNRRKPLKSLDKQIMSLNTCDAFRRKNNIQ